MEQQGAAEDVPELAAVQAEGGASEEEVDYGVGSAPTAKRARTEFRARILARRRQRVKQVYRSLHPVLDGLDQGGAGGSAGQPAVEEPTGEEDVGPGEAAPSPESGKLHDAEEDGEVEGGVDWRQSGAKRNPLFATGVGYKHKNGKVRPAE